MCSHINLMAQQSDFLVSKFSSLFLKKKSFFVSKDWLSNPFAVVCMAGQHYITPLRYYITQLQN